MKKTKWIAWLLVVAMLMTTMTIFAAKSSDYVTRGEVVDMLLTAADAYTPGLKRADIIKGDGSGDLREGAPVTKVEALLMLSRAFGTIPKLTGDSALTALPSVAFKDIPAWATTEVSNLTNAGIVVGTAPNLLGANENVTAQQMDLLIRRIWSIKGTNLKDDFYATINKSWLDSSAIPQGEMGDGNFNVMIRNADKVVQELIKSTLTTNAAKGTKEQKIADFYIGVKNAYDGKLSDLAPLKPYFDAIDQAKTLEDMVKLRTKIRTELGTDELIQYDVSADFNDSSKPVVSLSGLAATMAKDYYMAGGASMAAYRNYMAELLVLAGETPEQAKKNTELFYAMEEVLASAALDVEDQFNVDKANNRYSMAELQKLLPTLDLTAMLKSDGYTVPSVVLVFEPELMKAAATYYTDERLPELKANTKLSLIKYYGPTLSREVIAARDKFNQTFYGVEGTRTSDEIAAQKTQLHLSDYLGQMYVKDNFSAEAKQDVTDMIKNFVSVYKKRLQNIDWLGAQTKEKAIAKLDAMKIKVGYPDKWADTLAGVNITDNYFSNVVEIDKYELRESVARQHKEIDKSGWEMPAYTVNAYYSPLNNEIVFPAGFLQAPMYDKNASAEKNLGGIGIIIAHEITHSFDNSGAKFDKNGNAVNWWQPEDYKRFEEKCQQVVDYYDGIEIAPGIANNGTRTLGENIADLGAMACVLEVAKDIETPNYKDIFENMATCFASTSGRNVLEMRSNTDVHSFYKIRCNRLIQNFEIFQQTYGITEGDGMYLAPENRIEIW